MSDHRLNLIKELHSYKQRDTDSVGIVDRFLQLLENQRCFFRDHFTPGHVTGSAWVVDQNGSRVLLTHHRKLNMWLQLGGHTDGNENVLESAKREALEESGLPHLRSLSDTIYDLDIHSIPAQKSEPAHEHFDIRYVFVCDNHCDAYQVSDESHDLKWVEIEQIAEYTSEPSMIRMANRWRIIRQQLSA